MTPPQTQLPYMQYGSATHRPNKQKFFQAQRSAIAPVGIVAVVSMNTIMKKNSAMMLTSSRPARQNPFVPNRPYLNTPGVLGSPPNPKPLFSSETPGPSDAYQPSGTGPFHQLPQPSAKP